MRFTFGGGGLIFFIMVPEELKTAEQRVELLEQAMAFTSCGITLADARLPDMPLIYVNGAFEQMTGYPAEDVLGKNCRFLQGEEHDEEAIAAIHEAFENRTSVTVVLRNFRKDGTPFWNELHMSPIGHGGEVTHYVGIQTDVTRRVESEKALQESNARLEALSAEKDRLVGVAAHDLRGPLATIRSFIDLARDAADGEERSELLGTAAEVAENATAMLNDILDLSAVKHGRVEIKPEDTDLDAFVDTFAKRATQQARAKEIEFVLDRPSPLGRGRIDGKRVTQILNNLVSNAIKYAERGSRITLRTAVADNRLELTVEDQGQGIAEDQLPKLFAEFGTTDARPTENESRSGLGLSIVKRLVELHGGTVDVRSKVGEGSAFTVTLDI